MPRARANGIEIEYESIGQVAAEPVLLIMGHGGQLTMWPVELCLELVGRGLRVIRFDNRDVGLSAKLDHLGLPDWDAIGRAMAAGAPPPVPYSLDDMARDAVGLLDALGVARAHIVGASMGGMIAQLVAADFPGRTLSLTTLMCTASNPGIPIITAEAAEVFGASPSSPDPDAAVAHALWLAEWRQSPAYPTPREELRRMIEADVRRDYSPDGAARHGAASGAAYDRRAKLRTIRVPTVVVHGADDNVVPVDGAHDIARCVPGADVRIIPGMGHDLPAALAGVLADAVVSAAARAHAAAA